MLSCREVSNAVATDALKGTPWRRRLAVRLHLMMCKHCRRYAAQIRAIGDSARELFLEEEEDRERTRRLREAILDRARSDRASRGQDDVT